MDLRGSGHLTFQKGCYSIAYVLLEVKRHFLPSPHPTYPLVISSKNSVFFSYYLQKKVIETTKNVIVTGNIFSNVLGCFKSLNTSQGRQVVNTLKYTFFL